MTQDSTHKLDFPLKNVPAQARAGRLDGAAAWIARSAENVHGAPMHRGSAAAARHQAIPYGTSGEALSGLAFAVKDNIDVAGFATTAACAEFAYHPQQNAPVVQRLLDAGARVVGKTNLDQFACGLSGTRSPWGAVPNAFDARYISGGSSSGSAYVVATGQVDFALGTDTAGSGRVPAGLNNIVGLKPSRGLLSNQGVVGAAPSLDCVCIFAREVATATRVLSAAVDPAESLASWCELALRHAPLAGRFRFGVPQPLEFCGDAVAAAEFAQAVRLMRELGGEPVAIDFSSFYAAADMLYGSALVAERYFAIREFFDEHAAQIIEPVRSIIGSGRQYSAADLYAAQTRLANLRRSAQLVWSDIDVLVVPTVPTLYTIAAMQTDPVALNRSLGCYTNFVNLFDLAAIAVPASLRGDGLPAGITLIGQHGSDWRLAHLAQRFHHATGLAAGALGEPLPPMQDLRNPFENFARTAVGRVRVAVVGAHLSNMPLNHQLTERGACLHRVTRSAPLYRLYRLAGGPPERPGLLRVGAAQGAAIDLEVWDMPLAAYGSFVAGIPAPLGIGQIELADADPVQGFVCEAWATEGAEDITRFGGWRGYLASRASADRSGTTSACG